MAFQPQVDTDAEFPLHPLFAHAHEQSVGCWVSIDGRIDCELQQLTDSLDPYTTMHRYIRTMCGPVAAASRQTIRAYKACARSLLTLRVLVQNRRKDKTPILVFASRAQVLCLAPSTDAVQNGTAECDNLVAFSQDDVPRVAMGVAHDPWDHVPRLSIVQINTNEFVSSAPLPKQVKDADQGTILLSTGDFVVLQLQFRLGNDGTISKEWDALGTIEAIFLPYVPWNGVPAITQLPPLLPTVQSPTSVCGIPAIGHLLRVPLDQEAVRHYFADFWQHGKEVYMRTHFGATPSGNCPES
ncbi:uncharacterized protein TRAVEDRAFT_46351 [Trametes versicolor FP-101664 SS1]|uniref:uncharacterized protein n=1 Tax=Trametes versicolor (strain FP-101664) TaxID=717944 RepID=UPI0004623DA2|nr:uncharacterized protein TRAVEDRAFT_46351 [Trametes versicolor FP-101664 SS1]EIW61127.1 hypothetical protein TRAVEDRAFT_46351 [Trametes versicolor FP-101664 SS1]